MAWRYRYKGGKWTVQKNKPHWHREGMADVEIEPLYTHPCTSTPVVSQNAPDLEDKGGDAFAPSPTPHVRGAADAYVAEQGIEHSGGIIERAFEAGALWARLRSLPEGFTRKEIEDMLSIVLDEPQTVDGGGEYGPQESTDGWYARLEELDALLLEAKGRIEALEAALSAIIARSTNGELGSSKVVDMRNIAMNALGRSEPPADPKPPFAFADPNAQREWQRQRKDG
ncbi:hypothetical protein EVC10_029 [Rhizobium phage RHph_Y25]|nr:hypothetical protein EVC10_029 [Rhizobium phage RHph_Y25]